QIGVAHSADADPDERLARAAAGHGPIGDDARRTLADQREHHRSVAESTALRGPEGLAAAMAESTSRVTVQAPMSRADMRLHRPAASSLASLALCLALAPACGSESPRANDDPAPPSEPGPDG